MQGSKAWFELGSYDLPVEEGKGPKGADSRRNGSMPTVWAVLPGCCSCVDWRLQTWREGCLNRNAVLPPPGRTLEGFAAAFAAEPQVGPVCQECMGMTSMAL